MAYYILFYPQGNLPGMNIQCQSVNPFLQVRIVCVSFQSGGMVVALM
jgi:hypothetical protein